MELNKLYYFYITAKHQHVTRAAEELHIAQPALTKSIKLLEQDLGVPLFYKNKRNIYLTAFGQHLKTKLDTVFPILETIPRDLANMKTQAGNTVKINVLAASTIVTTAIVQYKKENADTVFHVIQNEEEMDCDISITTNAVNFSKIPQFESRCVFEEKIHLAVPRTSTLAKKDAISLIDVAEKGFVNLAGSRSFRTICDKFCLSAGFTPKIVFESDSPIAVKNLIATGAGIGFWPAFSWGESSADMKLLPIKNPLCQRELIVGLHNSGSLSNIATDFYNYLIDFMQEQQQKSEG